MIYVVNGKPGAGKTTFESIIQHLMGRRYVHILSTIDCVKAIARNCGWDGEKTSESRAFLSDLKDLLTRWTDLPFRQIKQDIENIKDDYALYLTHDFQDYIIFIDCREPEEIKRLCDEFDAKSVLIRRPSVENQESSNHADANVLDYTYDIEIINDGSLFELIDKANTFLDLEGFHPSKPVQLSMF